MGYYNNEIRPPRRPLHFSRRHRKRLVRKRQDDAVRATVKKKDGTEDVFGNVMSIHGDAEAYWLTVNYANSAGTFTKIYQTGDWKYVAIDADAAIDYNLPINKIA